MNFQLSAGAAALVFAVSIGASPSAHGQSPAPESKPQALLGISDSVWSQFAASKAYRNLPQPKAAKVVFEGTQDIEYTSGKPGSTTAIRKTIETVPVNGKCSRTRTETMLNGSRLLSDAYHCGGIALGLMGERGQPISRLEGIEALEGSLFPMRVGNRQKSVIRQGYPGGTFKDARQSSDCVVLSRLAAREVDSRLTGGAWKLHCTTSFTSATFNRSSEFDDYYLEELSTFLSALGQIDAVKGAAVLPSPGSQTVDAGPQSGPNGYRVVMSYASYDWSAGASALAATQLPPPSVLAEERAARWQAVDEKLRADRARQDAERESFRQSVREQAQALAQQQAEAQRQAVAQQQAAAQQQSSGPGLVGGLLGGVASRVMDRQIAKVTSAAAGSGAVGSVLADVNTRIANEAKDKIANDMGSTQAGRAGLNVASALTGRGAADSSGSGGSGASGTGAAASPSASATSQPALAACANVQYPGDKSDVQISGYDRIAQFDLCAYKATGDERYIADGNKQCRVLDGLLRSTPGNFQPYFCTGPSLRR